MALAPDGIIVMQKAFFPSSIIHAGFAMVAGASDGDRTTVTVRSISKSSCSPMCGTDSHRVHSCYQRRIADLPQAGRSVHLIAEVSRFRCAATQCGQQIVTEQFAAGVLAPWARRTGRLNVLVHHLGLAWRSACREPGQATDAAGQQRHVAKGGTSARVSTPIALIDCNSYYVSPSATCAASAMRLHESSLISASTRPAPCETCQ